MVNAGSSFQRRKDLKRAQIRIAYIILYYCGIRINEIRHLTKEDIQKAISASQFSLIHHETKQAHIHVLSKKAVQDLRNLITEFSIVFDKYNYQYLFGKVKPMTNKNLIKVINRDLKYTLQKYDLSYNIKSDSFRVNIITNLLKVTSVQNTANIIGHTDIRSTMTYNRYALSRIKRKVYHKKTVDETRSAIQAEIEGIIKDAQRIPKPYCNLVDLDFAISGPFLYTHLDFKHPVGSAILSK